MAKLPRKLQKVFALGASNNGQFGSAQTGAKVLSNDLDTLQSLAAFNTGWLSATVSAQKLPALEEDQGLHYIETSQIKYIFQEGVPEYLSTETYYTNSIVKKTETYELYGSKVNDNTGNALPVQTDDANWQYLGDLSGLGGILPTGTTSNTGNVYAVTLAPAPSALAQKRIYLVQFNAANTGASTLNANGLGAKAVVDAAGTALASGAIAANSYYFLIYDGTSFRIIGGGSVSFASNSDSNTGTATNKALTPANFGTQQTLGSAGYLQLPAGLIIQWGTTASLVPDTNTPVTFPITFTTACYGVNATLIKTVTPGIGDGAAVVNTITTSGFNAVNDANDSPAGSWPANWFATGK